MKLKLTTQPKKNLSNKISDLHTINIKLTTCFKLKNYISVQLSN